MMLSLNEIKIIIYNKDKERLYVQNSSQKDIESNCYTDGN